MADVEWNNQEGTPRFPARIRFTKKLHGPHPVSLSADSTALNTARLMHHVTEKGWQAGSVIGIGVVVPIVARRFSRTHGGSLAGAGPTVLRAAAAAGLVGAALSTAMGAARVGSLSSSLSADDFAAGMQDRAYRLHYNRGQLRTDLFCEVGMAVGGTAAMLAVSPAAWCVLGGAAVGTFGGLLAHAATAKAALGEGEK